MKPVSFLSLKGGRVLTSAPLSSREATRLARANAALPDLGHFIQLVKAAPTAVLLFIVVAAELPFWALDLRPGTVAMRDGLQIGIAPLEILDLVRARTDASLELPPVGPDEIIVLFMDREGATLMTVAERR